MTGNEIVLFEESLKPLVPQFQDLLMDIMPADRLVQSAIMCVTKNPRLLQADRQSFLNTIRGSAILGLEMDGTTGQAFPIPFKGIIQLVIGYKGYNTMGARAGLTITGEVVREGDPFDFDVGEGWVKHKPQGGTGKIIGAWAKAAANNRPAIVSWLPLRDIMAIKERSPGAKKSDSPWNDIAIGFPAMSTKSAKRRLARSTPLTVQAPQMHLAARMEEMFEEQRRPSVIAPTPHGLDVLEQQPLEGVIEPSSSEILNQKKPMGALLKTAREMALESEDAVTKWWGSIEQWQRNQLKEDLPNLRKLAKSPEAVLQEEGKEAAGWGEATLAGWWNDLPQAWKEKLDRYRTEVLMPMAAAGE